MSEAGISEELREFLRDLSQLDDHSIAEDLEEALDFLAELHEEIESSVERIEEGRQTIGDKVMEACEGPDQAFLSAFGYYRKTIEELESYLEEHRPGSLVAAAEALDQADLALVEAGRRVEALRRRAAGSAPVA